MSWFKWSPATHYKIATEKMDAWFHSFFKPTMAVKKVRIECDIYICGSADMVFEKFKTVNGHYPDVPRNIGGLCAGNQIYVVSAFTDTGIINNPLTIGHEVIHYLDARFVEMVDPDRYPEKEIYE